MEALVKIQAALEAPKNQFNKFGGYNYRSCEDILGAVKPLLGTAKLLLTDEIVLVGNRYYVKATATIKDGSEQESVSAYAREPENKKGMDEPQITGTASSYARKYALNGLFCIDDTKDPDSNEHRAEVENRAKASFGKPKETRTENAKAATGDYLHDKTKLTSSQQEIYRKGRDSWAEMNEIHPDIVDRKEFKKSVINALGHNAETDKEMESALLKMMSYNKKLAEATK